MDDPELIGCTLSSPELGDRRRAWEELSTSVVGRRRIERGFEVAYADGPQVGERLAGLARAEGGCCAWAAWAVRRSGDRWVLEVTSDRAEIEGLAAAFGA